MDTPVNIMTLEHVRLLERHLGRRILPDPRDSLVSVDIQTILPTQPNSLVSVDVDSIPGDSVSVLADPEEGEPRALALAQGAERHVEEFVSLYFGHFKANYNTIFEMLLEKKIDKYMDGIVAIAKATLTKPTQVNIQNNVESPLLTLLRQKRQKKLLQGVVDVES